jgi:hypothetical protein
MFHLLYPPNLGVNLPCIDVWLCSFSVPRGNIVYKFILASAFGISMMIRDGAWVPGTRA